MNGDIVFNQCIADTILRASDAAAGRMMLRLCKIRQEAPTRMVVYVGGACMKPDGEIAFLWELRTVGTIE
jgi:hypothetical protein|nr:MAG TPA: hypothetical protein [Siphoviridae sp. ctjRi1]